MTYSYDPTQIRAFGKDQIRFELGDTTVEGGENTCALCDEEYVAMLQDVTPSTWKAGKLAILSAILHKLSLQVDTKIDTLTYDFSSRVAHWQRLYDDLKAQVEQENTRYGTPLMAPMDKGHFWDGMHNNRRGVV